MKKRYDHLFETSFVVTTDSLNPEDLTLDEIIKALITRIPSLYLQGLDCFHLVDTFESTNKIEGEA